MSTQFELIAESRSDQGKGASRRLRRLADKIPAIVYGANKAAQPITFEHRLVLKALENEAFYSSILHLNIHGSIEQVVLKAVQRHVCKPKVLHLDFQRISATEKLHMHVPFHFVGEDKCPGVKKGGLIAHLMSDVEIKCLPKDLPEYIEVDVSNLELDEMIHLSDIKVPVGVELVMLSHGDDSDHDQSVVSVHLPRVAAEEETTTTTAEVPTVNDSNKTSS